MRTYIIPGPRALCLRPWTAATTLYMQTGPVRASSTTSTAVSRLWRSERARVHNGHLVTEVFIARKQNVTFCSQSGECWIFLTKQASPWRHDRGHHSLLVVVCVVCGKNSHSTYCKCTTYPWCTLYEEGIRPRQGGHFHNNQQKNR